MQNNSNGLHGLTTAQVRERIARKQVNKTDEIQTKTIRKIFLENVFSVFNIIIGLIILFLFFFYIKNHDKELLFDSIGVLAVALINTLIAIFQEIKAKIALDKVKLFLKKEVSILRDGKIRSIHPTEIVLDDVICLNRGDQAVVDGTVLDSNRMEIDESLLTGESAPIEKKKNDPILSGTFCVSGNGYYKVTKIGKDSYAANITKMAKKYKFSVTPLQKKIDFIVKTLFASAILIVLLMIIFNHNHPFDSQIVRRLATIMIGLVPQGLVLMASVTFSIGIYRISKIGAIVQKLNVIESFSNVQVICMDKTGTLTQNKLVVHKLTPISTPQFGSDNATCEKYVGTFAASSSEKNATIRALEIYKPQPNIEILDELPFSSTTKMSFLKIKEGDTTSIFILGAYDILIEKTNGENKTTAQDLFEKNRLSVYRNLLFATLRNTSAADISFDQIKDSLDTLELTPLCIVSITDKVREDAMETINHFKEKDIKFKILSGDSFSAIQALCREIGWELTEEDYIDGETLESLEKNQDSSTDFSTEINRRIVFSRLKPEHKLRIIKELRSQKVYTVMIGDGVNDLPAIKEADLGIAMEEGSSITKEVADIVLLQNKFSLLPEIFSEGNKIVNTVSSIAKLFLTKNFMVIYLSLLFIFFSLEFPLTPRRVSIINLFAIGLPSIIIALKNKNTEKNNQLIFDILTFASISAFFVVLFGYIGFYLSAGPLHFETYAQMIMLSIMIISFITSFLSVAVDKLDKSSIKYISYAAGLLIFYFFIATIVPRIALHSKIFDAFLKFYEINEIKLSAWGIILLISLLSSLSLLYVQKQRKIRIKKRKK